MRIKTHLAAIALAAIGALGLASPAAAQNATQCGVTGSATSPTPITFDPFSPSGLTDVTIPLTLTRATGPGGRKTQEAYFVLTQPAGSPNVQVTATTPGGSTFTNVLYYEGSVPGNLPVISNVAAGQIAIQFGGAAQPDQQTINIRVTIPPNADLSAGLPLRFDILYVCKGTGNLPDVLTPTVLPNAITINVNVLSALQATYVGSALDFGEVGDKTTTEVLAAPGTFTTPMINHVSVRSSGPYSVALASQNGYRLTFPGGSLSNAMHVLNYKLGFLNQTRSNANPMFSTVTCLRAGVPAAEADMLTIRATLLEGGQAKTPAANYSDILTVTVSPLLTGAPSQLNCPTLSPPM